MAVKQGDLDFFESVNVKMFIDGVEAKVGDLVADKLVRFDGINNHIILTCEFSGSSYDNWGAFLEYTAPFDISANGKSASKLIPKYMNDSFGDQWEIPEHTWIMQDITTEESVPVEIPFHTFNQNDLDILNSNNVALLVSGVPVELGQVVNFDQPIDAILLDNTRAFYLLENDNSSFNFEYLDDSLNPQIMNFTISEDGKSAFCPLVEPVDFNYFNRINIYTILDNVIGSNNVYLVNDNIVKQVNANRFKLDFNGDSVDKGVNILNLRNYPFSVDSDYLGDEENILLGDSDTGVKAPTLMSDTIYLDYGEIVVNLPDGNLYDYLGKECFLYLPYLEKVSVDIENVVNKTLKIIYKLNIYTGSVLVNIYHSDDVDPFMFINGVIGKDIPYILGVDDSPLNVGVNDVLSDITTPFIEIISKEIANKGGFFNTDFINEGMILDKKGYFIVDNINIVGGVLGDELRELKNILSSGVIVK